jgi:carboxy-terminal domain RNA polymerase II polypeptide A small phosphatase
MALCLFLRPKRLLIETTGQPQRCSRVVICPSPVRKMSHEMQERMVYSAEGSKEKEKLSPEDGAHGKKGRGLLHVPSRSSSQRNQPSPTSTGLSGATASDPRDSIGGHSKDSKASSTGQHRNGSVSSKHSAAGTNPTNTPANSQPSSPAVAHSHKKKKGGGLLAIFGCCGVPEDANALDNGDDVPATKLKDIPPRATTSRRTGTPSEQTTGSKTQVYEKEPQPVAQSTSESSKTKRASASTSQDHSTVGERETESKQTTLVGNSTPIVTVDPPQNQQQPEPVEENPRRDGDGDVEMRDAESSQLSKQPAGPSEVLPKVPPPPPITGAGMPTAPVSGNPPVVAEQAPEQKALLPPVEPHLKGRKCLVLDLDETLVHSSFKVCRRPSFRTGAATATNPFTRYSTRRTSRFRSRLRVTTTMSMSSRGLVWTSS